MVAESAPASRDLPRRLDVDGTQRPQTCLAPGPVSSSQLASDSRQDSWRLKIACGLESKAEPLRIVFAQLADRPRAGRTLFVYPPDGWLARADVAGAVSCRSAKLFVLLLVLVSLKLSEKLGWLVIHSAPSREMEMKKVASHRDCDRASGICAQKLARRQIFAETKQAQIVRRPVSRLAACLVDGRELQVESKKKTRETSANPEPKLDNKWPLFVQLQLGCWLCFVALSRLRTADL